MREFQSRHANTENVALMKRKIHPLTDLDKCTIDGPHLGQVMRYVPALYLLSLVGTEALKRHPEVAAYIDRAQRQLLHEAGIKPRVVRHSED